MFHYGLGLKWKVIMYTKNMDTEQKSINLLLKKQICITREITRISHWEISYSCQGITKCFMGPKKGRSLQTEKDILYLNTEMCKRVAYYMPSKASEGRRNCQIPQNKWKWCQSNRGFYDLVWAIISLLCHSLIDRVFLFFNVHKVSSSHNHCVSRFEELRLMH